MFQKQPVLIKNHVIIEAHPDVLKHMRNQGISGRIAAMYSADLPIGWFDKPNVTILEGKWQDFVESEELLSVGGFDVIYTDTFSEDYKGP